MALDADTGKVVWEYKFNIFQSDIPAHRVGWASPAADPEWTHLQYGNSSRCPRVQATTKRDGVSDSPQAAHEESCGTIPAASRSLTRNARPFAALA